MTQRLSWHTSSIFPTALFATILTAALSTLFLPAVTHAAAPTCEFASSDDDNDGWGWENAASCIVAGSQAVPTAAPITYCLYLASDDNEDGWGWENNASCRIGSESSTEAPATAIYVPVANVDGKQVCQTDGADPDGDGYGWENNSSCVVSGSSAAAPVAQSNRTSCKFASADSDNDGWGWEDGASCVVDTSTDTVVTAEDPVIVVTPTEDPVAVVTPTEGTVADVIPKEDPVTVITPIEFLPSDITDLILVTGQSNTLGANTVVNETLDAPNPRVFAYTSNGWEVAELYQSWDNGPHPGTGDRSDADQIHNNFALHFGKRLAELDSEAVVGFLVVSEPGEGIEHWNSGNTGMTRAQQKTFAAINELPHKTGLDGILWHQGETDWILEGTSDPDVTQPAPIDYYPVKLNQLIDNFRLENWFDANKPFICGETIEAEGVNTHLNSLNADSDPKTACVAGAGLTAVTAGGSHFNAASLRTMGVRYAESYHLLR